MNRWTYGDAYLRHPIEKGQVAVFDDGSMVAPHNIFDPLPSFMKHADLIFVDPPWNLGNLNTFYTKAGRVDHQKSFEYFYKRLFECISEISPLTCYVEVGKEYLGEFIQEMKHLYRCVTFYNSTYYHRKDNLCYIIRGGAKHQKLPLDYLDEEDVIAWICEHEEYSCIGDLCMGLGLVGAHAHRCGKRFVGTELNEKRLAVLLDRLARDGARYRIEVIAR